MRRQVHRGRSSGPPAPVETSKVFISGTVLCPICGDGLTQADANAGSIMGIGGTHGMLLFCLRHFYVRLDDGQVVQIEETEYAKNLEIVARLIAEVAK